MMAAPFSPQAVSPLADARATTPVVGAAQAAVLAVADLSMQARFGCKGPGAAAWLAGQGVQIPAQYNSAVKMDDGTLVLRLGVTEFLVEGSASRVAALAALPRVAGVYPVLRQDACLRLSGSAVAKLLLQSCNVNFAALDLAAAPVVLTSMVGVGVTVLPEASASGTSYRVWCDGTYGTYLWQTLCTIAQDLGGGAVADKT